VGAGETPALLLFSGAVMAFDPGRYRAYLGDHPHDLVYHAVVGSTMDVARDLARAGAPHGTTVLADEQTAGRGRFQRRWVAPVGDNLTFTILTRPPLPVAERLSIVAALAVADAAEAAGVPVRFKWPNDVLARGRKLAGILIEGELEGSSPTFALVGIGLNVNQDSRAAAEIADIAISLRDITRTVHDRESVLAGLRLAFDRWFERAPAPATLDAWASRLDTLGRQVRVSFAGRVEEGLAESVTSTGALVLRRADRSTVELPAGEVTTRVDDAAVRESSA
jgi:BirA family transcriptional regulator, biotin operon repressor / biotin---[acetyl-CoA-carboxylase] ligase